jgi:hypothetical protein
MFIENRDYDRFHHERVLRESDLWITFSGNGKISLHSRVVGNSARKRKSTYFLEKGNLIGKALPLPTPTPGSVLDFLEGFLVVFGVGGVQIRKFLEIDGEVIGKEA